MTLRRWPLPWLALLALAAALAAADDPDPAAEDVRTLRAADLPADGPGLLDFFRSRSLADADHSRALRLVRRCGDPDFDVRERAAADLRAMGAAVRPLLRDALDDPDPEIAFRAQRCLAAIDRSCTPAALAAAVRTLGRLRPPATAEALLETLPTLEDAEVVDEACRALAAAAVRDGEADPAVVRALADPTPLRRAAAGEALARAGGLGRRPAARRLLADPDPSVRGRVALALFECRDREAVPALIDLLADPPAGFGGRVEESLLLAAGDQAPAVSAGDDAASRRKCRDAWADWWRRRGAAVDLAAVDFSHRLLGYTLVAELDRGGRGGRGGRVVEYDAAGKERWSIPGLRYVIDAQVVGRDRVLVAEYIDRSVTERDLKGDVVWQYKADGLVLGARRLADGNTFVVTRNRLVEVDKDGKEVLNLPRPNDVCAAARFRDGAIALLTNAGQVLRLDRSGKEVKSAALAAPAMSVGTNIEALPDGGVLVPLFSANKVVEIDADGKTVWEAATTQPTSVARLPNGHTLVGSRLAMTVVELDGGGKEVKSVRTEGRPFRVGGR